MTLTRLISFCLFLAHFLPSDSSGCFCVQWHIIIVIMKWMIGHGVNVYFFCSVSCEMSETNLCARHTIYCTPVQSALQPNKDKSNDNERDVRSHISVKVLHVFFHQFSEYFEKYYRMWVWNAIGQKWYMRFLSEQRTYCFVKYIAIWERERGRNGTCGTHIHKQNGWKRLLDCLNGR